MKTNGFAWAFVASMLAGCGGMKAAAEVTYDGQQLSCVDRYETRAEVDACRERVREAWGRLPDGGRATATEGGAR